MDGGAAGSISDHGLGGAGEQKGPPMNRFRSPMVSLAISLLLTLLSVATVLAEGHPPIPR
jgi:heme/copper-type cytochrome/quinol oxidase subunit 4